MRILYLITYFICLAFFACQTRGGPTPSPKRVIITIQPFIGTSEKDARFIYYQIKNRYAFVELKNPRMLPAFAFTSERHRYRADSIINWLASTTPDGQITIGITSADISTTKGPIGDWGVIGLALQPGKACIASTFRLSASQRQPQLLKIAIHEIGHTLGLGHCAVKTCFMRDAEGKNPTNEEIEFCSSCKRELVEKGFSF